MPLRLSGRIDGRQAALPLHEGSNVLGSAEGCDLRLDHPTVSRRHARLEVTGDAVELVDLGSSNGTLVAGQRVQRQTVRAGDAITFGHVTLALEWLAADDVESALPLDLPSAVAAAPPDTRATVGTHGLESFVLEHLPAIVARLAEGAPPTTVAQAAGAALFASVPCLAVEVLAGEDGVLFEARRETAENGAPVRAGDAELSVRATFAHERTARLHEPLVQALADLLRLSAPGPPRPARAAAAPALPDPPTVVPELQRLFAEAALVARGEVGVLISGESGTGKEVLARFIHSASARAGGPFVALNCAALPRDLLETELFGIERGVATGVDARPGKFELAHGGTLFLDEIGDMALETQARILRVLQEREVYRIGGQAPRKAAVRVVAATNRDVPRMLAEGRFREDLYYRVATWLAEMPPLRRRRADIPNLAAHFLARECARRGVRARGISRAALEALQTHAWPGNVRQLENEMARAALFLGDGDLLDTGRLGPALKEPAPASGGRLEDVLEHAERDAIVRALQEHGHDVTAAAAALGLGRSTLYRRMKALGLTPEA